jgi:hypothetical protein
MNCVHDNNGNIILLRFLDNKNKILNENGSSLKRIQITRFKVLNKFFNKKF